LGLVVCNNSWYLEIRHVNMPIILDKILEYGMNGWTQLNHRLGILGMIFWYTRLAKKLSQPWPWPSMRFPLHKSGSLFVSCAVSSCRKTRITKRDKDWNVQSFEQYQPWTHWMHGFQDRWLSWIACHLPLWLGTGLGLSAMDHLMIPCFKN